MEEENNNHKRSFLFGSIGKKLVWAFGVLIVIMVLIVSITYVLNRNLESSQNALRDVEAPLELMVWEVIGYDAILTGSAHEALLHVEKGDFGKLEEHKAKYDEAGVKLDDLLKVRAKALVEKSKRTNEEREKTIFILSELDRVNLLLVDLETRAFDAMEKGDSESARGLIVTNQYEGYKDELKNLYTQFGNIQAGISERYGQEILKSSRDIQRYNIILGILFLLVAVSVLLIINKKIAVPVKELYTSTLELERGNYNTRTKIKSGDELEDLGTAFNETTEQLGRLDEERKQVDKAKTEFLSITSHELRSPMTPMKAQLQMLGEGFFGKLNSKQRESVDIVLRNTDRLDKIIVDFLEISRIEAARLKFNFIKTDLEPYIKRLKEEMDGFMPEKKIVIELNVGNLPTFEVDPDRVMQVLRNLVNNAKKFSPEKGKINIYVQRKGDFVQFTVKDNGVGMKKETQTRVFEPFYQVDNMYQHKSGGTGLGLAICKGIVESQNGSIWFNSIEGQGTTFYFTIPLTPVREIKAIRLLFSAKQDVEKKVKEIMLEMLGPLAEREFEDLKIKGILEDNLIEYIDFLKKKKIIEHTEEFKNKIRLIFEGEGKKR
jgi:signal transduction histidine kinase